MTESVTEPVTSPVRPDAPPEPVRWPPGVASRGILLGGGGSAGGPERGTAARILQLAAVLTVAVASFEGYLLEFGSTLTKVPAALLVAAWAWTRLRERRLPRRHPVHLPLAALAVVVLASAAVHSGDTFTLEYLIRWCPFLLTAFVLLDVVSREVPVRLLLGASVAGALVAAGGAVYSFAVLGDLRATGPLEDPNDLAYVIVAALPLLVALTVRSGPAAGRRAGGVVLVVVAAVLVVGAAVTVSRGGALALAVAVVWLAVRRAVPKRVLLAAAGAVLAVGAVAVVALGPLVATALQQKGYIGSSNVDTRALRWQVALRMLADEPLLGVGPGGYRGNYMAASHNAELAEQTPVAHNMYVEVAAELGLLGLAAFAAVVVAALLAVERAVRRGGDRTIGLAVQASLISVLVASTFLSEQYYMPLWSTIAVACALDLRTERKRSR